MNSKQRRVYKRAERKAEVRAVTKEIEAEIERRLITAFFGEPDPCIPMDGVPAEKISRIVKQVIAGAFPYVPPTIEVAYVNKEDRSMGVVFTCPEPMLAGVFKL